MADNCIFCRINAGNTPSYKIYEDEHTLAFLDVYPNSIGHTLIIPKPHERNFITADEETISKVMRTLQKVAKHYVDNCGYDGAQIITNNEKCAGQMIFHWHVHLIPYTEAQPFPLAEKPRLSPKEFEELTKKLRLK